MRITNISLNSFARNITAGDFLEDFLISAIASFLIIRFFLLITGYPQISGGSFHIAHMLWGGLFMFIALTLLFTYLNRPAHLTAAVVGGIGFGAFVDELGKFITRDNNYFFQPTIAIIYVIFIMLYLLIKLLESRKNFSQKEYLINALEVLKEAVQSDMDSHERSLARHYLAKCDPDDPFVKDLKDILEKASLAKRPPTTLPTIIKRELHEFYLKLVQTHWFVKTTLIVFGFSAIFTLLRSIVFTVTANSENISFLVEASDLTFSSYAQLISSSASAILVILGGMVIFQNRLKGFMLLKYSVVISIFFTQVFAFYHHELSALIGLLWNIFLFTLIQYYITEEQMIRRD